MVHKSFFKLLPDKQDLIIEAGVKVFLEKGYHKASTEQIVARAGIAKGALFYYFKSKKLFYLYLVEKTRDMLEEKLRSKLEEIETDDFFDRIVQAIVMKWRLSVEYPLETQFVTDALLNPVPEVNKEIAALNQKYMDKYHDKNTQEAFYDRELLSKLPLRVSPERALTVSAMILEGISKKYIERFRREGRMESFAGLAEELELYNDILRHGVLDRGEAKRG